jgi:hypothetical protein
MKFSIRDLLWLTLLAAVLVAWWMDRSRLAERLRPFLRLERINNAVRKDATDVEDQPLPTPSAPAPKTPKK